MALFDGVTRFNKVTNGRFELLGLGMHPFLTLDQTTYWDHEDKDIYDVYDRLFDLKQHGWLNIQALQVNVHYENETDLLRKFARMRSLIPYLVALTASSPMVEGKLTGLMDNRIYHYRKNQERVPSICNNMIPEKLTSKKQHDQILNGIFTDLRKIGGDALCNEWIDSRGVVIRYHRECLELKACDEQECIRSDMAVTAFLLALLRADIDLEDDQDMLLRMNEEAMTKGVSAFRPELYRLYEAASKVSNEDERGYLALIRHRIESGSIAEIICEQIKDGARSKELVHGLAKCLRTNSPY